jgi:signal transduction histidine kinase
MTDSERVAELKSYEILDTVAERELNEIVELASALCNTPIAQITLVDGNRQVIMASYGWSAGETTREDSFCDQAINNPYQMLEVADSFEDDRFRTNPFVTGAPNIRFYAGSPLVTGSGYVLGTLCVIDTKPGVLSDRARRSLRILTDRVMHYLEIRRTNIALRKQLTQITERLGVMRAKSDNDSADQISRKYIDLIEEILFSISHTIRGPITTLEGLLYLLTQHEELDKQTMLAYLERIKEVVDQLTDRTSVLTRTFVKKRSETE